MASGNAYVLGNSRKTYKYVPPKWSVNPKLNFPSAGFPDCLKLTPIITCHGDKNENYLKFF